jgi:hypothetical protein
MSGKIQKHEMKKSGGGAGRGPAHIYKQGRGRNTGFSSWTKRVQRLFYSMYLSLKEQVYRGCRGRVKKINAAKSRGIEEGKKRTRGKSEIEASGRWGRGQKVQSR